MSLGSDAINDIDCKTGDEPMSDKPEIEFVDGLFIKKPENAPDYVICKLSITRKELGNWLRNKTDEYINIDVLESKAGKYYAKVDNWKPTPAQINEAKLAAEPDFDDDLPF